MSAKKEALHGQLTWKPVSFKDQMEDQRRANRIIGLTFPASNLSLGLEPSVLNVLPHGNNVEYSLENRLFNDGDVKLYLCSVYISGMEEFEKWAGQHDGGKIVVGGYHPTTFPREFLRYAYKIVQGPCDDIFATIEQNGQIVPGITSNHNLPRRDLYDIRHNQQIIPDKLPNDVVVSINTSAGCSTTPPCDFCCSPIMCSRVLSRPIEFVEAELRTLTTYNSKFCFIRDENFTLQRDWRERLALIHQYLPNTRLYLFASANTLNEEKAVYMARNGVYMICLGLEDPTVEYGKNRKLDEVVGCLKRAGIMVYLSFIVNPLNIIGTEEAKRFYQILMDRIMSLAPEMICGNFLMPFPGTGLWDKYYAFVSRDDYKYFDSKTPFLIRNPVVRAKMQFFMFWHQWQYFTSKFYEQNVRRFYCGDTLHLRFMELFREFQARYERIWNVRA